MPGYDEDKAPDEQPSTEEAVEQMANDDATKALKGIDKIRIQEMQDQLQVIADTMKAYYTGPEWPLVRGRVEQAILKIDLLSADAKGQDQEVEEEVDE